MISTERDNVECVITTVDGVKKAGRKHQMISLSSSLTSLTLLMILGSMLTLRKCVEVAHCRTFPQLEPRPRQQLAPDDDCQDLEKQSFSGEDENLDEHLVDSPG